MKKMLLLAVFLTVFLTGCQTASNPQPEKVEQDCKPLDAEWLYKDDVWGLAICGRFYPIPWELMAGSGR
jgi:PBP1b-binding outer membrane lipoprotein LpoB